MNIAERETKRPSQNKMIIKKNKENQLEIKTIAYQAKNGGIFLDWGNTVIKLEKMYADNIAYDIPDFNLEDYNNFYK
jgi:hypothetical protein